MKEALDSTPLAEDAEALRARMADDGYLLLRQVMPAVALQPLRDALGLILEQQRLISSGSGSAGEFRPIRPDVAVDVHSDTAMFRQLYAVEALHRLPHQPELVDLVARLLFRPSARSADRRVLVHPRPALRVVFPGTPGPVGATPPHQDHLGMQGTTETYTIWAPLSPCDQQTGVLALARGSHRGGPRSYSPVPEARVAGCDSTDLRGDWITGDLEPGDVFVFHSLTVHQALPNVSDQVRLSVDARYQSAAEPICAVSLGDPPHMTWDDVYANWPAGSEGLQRYWEGMAERIVPFDASAFAAPS